MIRNKEIITLAVNLVYYLYICREFINIGLLTRRILREHNIANPMEFVAQYLFCYDLHSTLNHGLLEALE
tara:strand:+ start:791 stop:1000 length:210 start_codon:yes stop_codon:yes gene_type:complete